MYTLSWKGFGETTRILFDSEDSAKIWDEFFVFGKADAEKSPKDTMIATHRNCYFVPIINIMYTLS